MKKDRSHLISSDSGGRSEEITSAHVKDEKSIRPVDQQALQGEWENLDSEQKAVLRAQRARRGQRCSSCGCVGYFRRNCPTCPPVRYDVKTGGWRRREAGCVNEKSGTGHQSLPLGPNHHGKGEEVRGGTGRGFLWGDLAKEAMQGYRRDGGKIDDRIPRGADARSCSGPEAMVLDILPLNGSSKLSSAIILGAGKGLAWTDVNVKTTPYSISSRVEANDEIDSSVEGGQHQGGVKSPTEIDRKLAWRWREFSSATATKMAGSVNQSQVTEAFAIEENLHLALVRLLEAAKHQASIVVSQPFGTEILRDPTRVPPRGHVMPTATFKAYRDVFAEEEDKAHTIQQPKAHKYLGNLREEGELKYVFDRTSHKRRGSLASHLRHATSGKAKRTRIARSEEASRHQRVWVEHQKRAMEQRREKANRLLKVLRSELVKERMREIEVMRHSGREKRHHLSKATIDRVVAADRIVRTIKQFGLLGNMEDAHYILYALNAARRAGLAPKRTALSADVQAVPDPNPPRKFDDLGSNALEICGEDGRHHVPSPGAIPPNPCAAAAGTTERGDRQQQLEEGNGNNGRIRSKRRAFVKSPSYPQLNEDDDEMSPYALRLSRPATIAKLSTGKAARIWGGVNAPRVTRDSHPKKDQAAEKPNSSLRIHSERLMSGFHSTGHNIRKGVDDDTTAVPAIIPVPKAFSSGKASGLEKVSFTAGRIFHSLKRAQVNPITGRTTKIAAPLWHRATGEIDHARAGSILYSDLIGHTYSVLLGPKIKK